MGAIVVILIILILVFSGQNKNKETIKIGFLGPLTGDAALYGLNAQKGAQLAIDEINSNGGVDGKKIELISEDSKCNSSLGVSAFNKLISADKIDYLLGDMCSSVTLAVSSMAEENKIVVMSPGSTNYQISNSGDYIFRTVPSDALQGKKGAEIAYENNYRKAAIFYIGDNDYGEGLKKVFNERFTELGGEVVFSESHLSGDTDFKTQLIKIKSKNPDVLYLPTQTQEAGLIIKQAQELNLNIPIIGTETMQNVQFLNLTNDSSEKVTFTSFSEFDGESATKFLESYKEKYNVEEKDIYSDYSYDAVYAIVNSMKKCNRITPECVKTNLYSVYFMGSTGPVSFDKNGDVEGKDFTVFKVEDGKFIRQ